MTYGEPQRRQSYGQAYGGAGAPYVVRPERRGVGVVGVVFALAGLAAGLIALLALQWFAGFGSVNAGKFNHIHRTIDQLGGASTGVGKAYFDWLAWTLLIAGTVLALLANIPTPASPGLRILGALVGLAGIGFTFWGIQFVHGPAYTEFLKHARVGFYVMLAGFLLITIGALIGPRRVTD